MVLYSQRLVYDEACFHATLHRGDDSRVSDVSEAQAEPESYTLRAYRLRRVHWELLDTEPIVSYMDVPWEISHIRLLSSRRAHWELHGTPVRVKTRASGFFSGEKALSSSHYSSLPPCSEMILQEVTLDGKQSM